MNNRISVRNAVLISCLSLYRAHLSFSTNGVYFYVATLFISGDMHPYRYSITVTRSEPKLNLNYYPLFAVPFLLQKWHCEKWIVIEMELRLILPIFYHSTRSVCRVMENTVFPKTYDNRTLIFLDLWDGLVIEIRIQSDYLI